MEARRGCIGARQPFGRDHVNQLIVSLHSGSERVTPAEVRKVVKDMLEIQLEDMWFLVDKNMDEIIKRATKGRVIE